MEGLILASIITTVFVLIISGFLSLELLNKKGYESGFWIGFVFGILGLIYTAGLPDISKKRIVKKNKKQILENDEEELEDNDKNEQYIYCENCGFSIWDDEKKCSNCGKSKKK